MNKAKNRNKLIHVLTSLFLVFAICIIITPNIDYAYGVSEDFLKALNDSANGKDISGFQGGISSLTQQPKSKCTIHFDGNNHNGEMKDVTVDGGSEYTLPGCSFQIMPWEEFDSWTIGNGNTRYPGDKITISNDTTIKANYKINPTFAICTVVVIGIIIIAYYINKVAKRKSELSSNSETRNEDITTKPSTEEKVTANSVADEIKKFKELYDDKVITKAEFEKKKKELLEK